jgi:DNA-binding NarL/FixJ family response regulator
VVDPDEEDLGVAIHIFASDPVSRAGVAAQLGKEGMTRLVPEGELTANTVVVAVADRLEGEVVHEIAALRRSCHSRMILVAQVVDDAILLRATELGFAGIIRRRDATGPMLAGAVHAVIAGDGSLPPDLIGRLLGVMEHLQSRVLVPHGLSAHGFTEREITVLRLVADGLDTAQIACELSYSERTIKDILHQLNARLQLRNRTHAVAFAMRAGLL